MPDYIVSGRDEDGRRVTRMVKTATAQDALDIMRDRACTDLVLHTDDIAAATLRSYAPNLKISPAELIKQGRLSAVGRLFRALRPVFAISVVAILVILAIFFGASFLPGGQFPWGPLALIPTAGLIIVGLLVSRWHRGVWHYERVMRAIALAQWDTALRLAAGRRTILAREMAFRHALALAGAGRLDEALDQHARQDARKSPEWLDLVRRSDIRVYGGDIEGSIADMQAAMRLSPMNPTVMLLLAIKLLRHRHDVAGARELLACAVANPIAVNIGHLPPMVEGLIALNENAPQRACKRFVAALDDLGPRQSDPMFELVDASIRGHLAVARARLGERDVAEREFRRAERYLRAHRFFDPVVQEYQDAMAGK